MSNKIMECVPNFSEARDMAKIQQITDAIESVPQITLLDVDPGPDMNRTVVTFIGPPQAVAEAAFLAVKKAGELIDMTTHQGSHPRMGATDVCPFVPVEGVTMQDCVDVAKQVGQRIGSELHTPVYLYEEAATKPERKNLATVRKGEYEGLPQKLSDPNWKPDFGPAEFNKKSGATAVGAREFLVAYNITLNTREKKLAWDIALELRERGRVARTGNITPHYFKGDLLFYQQHSYPCGSCSFISKTLEEMVAHCEREHKYNLLDLLKLNEVKLDNLVGQKVYKPGLFSHCKAIGWYVDAFDRTQISINLTNYKVTPPHLVLEATRRLAMEKGIVVTGSEIVGLIPFQAMAQAAQYYYAQQGKSHGVPTMDQLKTVVYSMGLRDVSPFDISKKVIGLPNELHEHLVTMTVKAFVDEVSRDTPAPGGGSIAALAGAIGASLASMVCNLTQGKEGTEEKDARLTEIAVQSQSIKEVLIHGIDADTNAFNDYMDARRLPQKTTDEKALRTQKMTEGLKSAINVPYQTALSSFEAMKLAQEAAQLGNVNSITDASVGVQIGFAGVRGGILNVLINLKEIDDTPYIQEMQQKCADLFKKAHQLVSESNESVDQKINEMILNRHNKPVDRSSSI